MAIHKAMLLALRALSYPAALDVGKTYKAERFLRALKTPLAPLYHLRDNKLLRDGREIPIRLYTPPHQSDNRLLLFFHGGGWVLENVDTYDSVCRNLARKTGCRVASVEYALAPEYPFPTGLEDCYAAARTIFLHPENFNVSAEDITLIGDSAGGNLAAAVSLLARDRGEFSISRQILIYPATWNDHSPTSPFPSVQENGTGYLLTSQRVCDFMRLYAGEHPENLQNPYFAPLLCQDLSHQPATLLISAEFDPLRDEGEAYAAALRVAGNPVVQYRMPDALHGFFSLPPRFSHVKRTYQLINRFLNRDSAYVKEKDSQLEPSG